MVKQLITLAVPIYNMEQYLPRCMASLLNQTCRDYEILLIDDGSTDSSAALCDGYAAAYPELVRVVHKPNGGLPSARNVGIDHARGAFIIFPDPDDWVEPNYVQAFLEHQRQHRADMVSLGHYVDTDSQSTPIDPDGESVLLHGAEIQRCVLLPPRMQGFSSVKLYRLDLIRRHGLYFLDGLGTTEDLDFCYRYLACCGVVFHDPRCRIYHYYQREDSSTLSGFSSEKLGMLRTFERIIEDCGLRDPELAQAARDEICTAAVNLLWMHERTPMPDPAVRAMLLSRIRSCLPGYLRTRHYSWGRKLQAVLAALSPSLYTLIKNLVRYRYAAMDRN